MKNPYGRTIWPHKDGETVEGGHIADALNAALGAKAIAYILDNDDRLRELAGDFPEGDDPEPLAGNIRGGLMSALHAVHAELITHLGYLDEEAEKVVRLKTGTD